MSQHKIAVFNGSMCNDSSNTKLATALAALAPEDFEFKHIDTEDLPLYNPDESENPFMAVQRIKTDIASAHGILFVARECNRSIPNALKNAIDHVLHSCKRTEWIGKPAGVIGTSITALGTTTAQQHSRNILAYFNMQTLSQPEAFIHAKEGLFDLNGNIGIDSKVLLQSWVNRYVIWVKKHVDTNL